MPAPARRNGKKSSRKYMSFFSGALGFDIGFEAAGYECLSLNEIDRTACETIRANLGNVFGRKQPKLYASDVRQLTPDFLREDLQLREQELFCIIGGPPCQAFSTAGRRLGLNDERGNVFLHFIRLIGELRPKYAVFENVRGILSAPLLHRPHVERGAGYPALSADELPKGALRHVLRMLQEYGYTTTFNLYNTANFGVPQARERVIFFASREGNAVPFLTPTHDEHGRDGLLPWKTVREAMSEVQRAEHEGTAFPQRRLEFFKMLTAGQNWRGLPVAAQKKAMGQSFYSGGGRTGFYRRLAFDRPSPTLVTAPTMPATDLCHPTELRPLSVQEYAVIQTYPSGFQFLGKTADKYRQLGNAVPCRFGKVIAEHLTAFDQGKLTASSHDARLSRYGGTDHASWLTQT